MRKNHGWAAFWQKKQYIIAGTLVILAAVGMTVLYSRGQEQERKQLEQEIAAEMDTENQNVALEEETEDAGDPQEFQELQDALEEENDSAEEVFDEEDFYVEEDMLTGKEDQKEKDV